MSEQLRPAIEAGQPLLCSSWLRAGREAAGPSATHEVEETGRRAMMFNQSLKQFSLVKIKVIYDLEKCILNGVWYPELDTGREKKKDISGKLVTSDDSWSFVNDDGPRLASWF